MGNTIEALPWASEELEKLLLNLISHGSEVAKADFKVDIELVTAEQKAELLKDISAIANTSDSSYLDHGFLIFGVSGKRITGATKTESNVDSFQGQVEQLLKSNISPMIDVRIVEFSDEKGNRWGAIVIPPRNDKPYMFFKDFSCQDRSRQRRKGEWFIRQGATTEVGLPEDLARIIRRQSERVLEPLRESIVNLQARVSHAEQQYASALFKLVEGAVATTGRATGSSEFRVVSDLGDVLGIDLPGRLMQELKTEDDWVSEELQAEARRLREMLEVAAGTIPWAPQLNDAESSKAVVDTLESAIRELQISIGILILKDRKGKYASAVLAATKIIAQKISVPSGTQYNRFGEEIRTYPFGILMYTIAVCAVAANRGDLLSQLFSMTLKRDHRRDTQNRTIDVLRRAYYPREFLNHAMNSRWLEPMPQRVRQLLRDNVGEMLRDGTETEYFFRGEFILALAGVDSQMTSSSDPEDWYPLPGLYLYFDEAQDVIADFLSEPPAWITTVFKNPIEKVLGAFDSNRHRLVSREGFGTRAPRQTALEVYQKAIEAKK